MDTFMIAWSKKENKLFWKYLEALIAALASLVYLYIHHVDKKIGWIYCQSFFGEEVED